MCCVVTVAGQLCRHPIHYVNSAACPLGVSSQCLLSSCCEGYMQLCYYSSNEIFLLLYVGPKVSSQ
jgi:hypothetical protein